MAGRSQHRNPTRRRFLQFSAAAASTVVLSNCARQINQHSTPESTSSPASSPASNAQGNTQTLYLYTWADFVNEELFQRFTQKTGIPIVVDTYDSNETMLAKLQAGGGDQYSLVSPSDYMVRQMVEGNLLLKLDPTKLQGTANLMPRWKNPPYDPNNQHSIPFSCGTTGLIYNKEVLKAEPTDWNFLWENREALNGKMTLSDDVRETMGMVLKSLGYSYNATDPAQIEAAYRKLMEIKPNLAGFKSFGWEDQLVAGDLAVCMTYSLLGNSLPLENPQLVYVIPKSGTSLWTDTMAIPQKAPNVEAAYAWLNFILEPENAAYAATLLKLGTPNQAAFELLPAATKSNAKVYPTEALLKVSEGIAPVGSALDLYDRYWTELKSA